MSEHEVTPGPYSSNRVPSVHEMAAMIYAAMLAKDGYNETTSVSFKEVALLRKMAYRYANLWARDMDPTTPRETARCPTCGELRGSLEGKH